MITTSFKIATLLPEHVSEYERLHNQIPESNLRHMREAGIRSLRIFRDGLILIMYTEVDESAAIPNRVIDQKAEEDWHRLTGACFDSFWREVPEIFCFSHPLQTEEGKK